MQGLRSVGQHSREVVRKTKARVPVPVIPPATLLSSKVRDTTMCLCRKVLVGKNMGMTVLPRLWSW